MTQAATNSTSSLVIVLEQSI